MSVQGLRRALRIAVGCVTAIYLALVVFLAVYGVAAVHADDRSVLRREGRTDPVILVGLMAAQRESRDGPPLEDRRYYFAVPTSLVEQSLWVVADTYRDEPSVSTSAPAARRASASRPAFACVDSAICRMPSGPW